MEGKQATCVLQEEKYVFEPVKHEIIEGPGKKKKTQLSYRESGNKTGI